MAHKNRIDFHIHTDNSDDGFDPVMLMCEHAVATGLRAAAITDHCECNRYRNDHFDKAIRQSYFETRKAREAFKDRIILMCGMELGQPMQDLEAAEDALSANQYDFVLGSLHNVSGEADFWKVDYEHKDADELFGRYMTELYAMVKWNRFDSLAHLTYPLRYIIGEHHIDFDLNKYMEPIDEILKLLARNEKALEINTSGYRQPYGKPLPHLEIVKRFKEVGGRHITLGSDAHHSTDIGKNIDDGLEVAKAAGFSFVTIYEQRVPMQVPIL